MNQNGKQEDKKKVYRLKHLPLKGQTVAHRVTTLEKAINFIGLVFDENAGDKKLPKNLRELFDEVK